MEGIKVSIIKDFLLFLVDIIIQNNNSNNVFSVCIVSEMGTVL